MHVEGAVSFYFRRFSIQTMRLSSPAGAEGSDRRLPPDDRTQNPKGEYIVEPQTIAAVNPVAG